MENTGNFRKALFGFNTKDVMEYIAMLHNEYYAYRQQSEKEIYDLNRRIEELEEATPTKQEESVFGAEHEEILAMNDTACSERIENAVERLENLADELEKIISDSTQEKAE